MTSIALARPVLLVADTKGFDIDLPLTPAMARAFKDHQYEFVGRYIRRLADTAPAKGDLSIVELEMLLETGLGVLPIQHVEPGTWIATGDKGTMYGRGAVRALTELGVPRGTPVVLDLEMVGSPAAAVEAYCRNWYAVVWTAGYSPMLYVGWNAVLGPKALHNLPFLRYFSAYNLPIDQYPAVRGCCLHQRSAKPEDLPPGIGLTADEIDVDTAVEDGLNTLPLALLPAPPVAA